MLLLFDLDGVVYRGRRPVPGMPELLVRRATAGDTLIYCTNNSRWHRSDYEAHLKEIGAPVTPELIVTAARATAVALVDRGASLVMVLGGPGLARELLDVGLRVVEPTPEGLSAEPDALAVGVDFDLTYERLSTAAEVVRRGATFVATNRDPVYPTPDGLSAGAGAIVAAVEVAGGGRAPDVVVGKPSPGLFQAAAELAGVPVEEAIVVGDGLGTDIAAAKAVRARCVLVLTGVTTQQQLEAAGPELRPDAVAQDAMELEALLERWADSATAGPSPGQARG